MPCPLFVWTGEEREGSGSGAMGVQLKMKVCKCFEYNPVSFLVRPSNFPAPCHRPKSYSSLFFSSPPLARTRLHWPYWPGCRSDGVVITEAAVPWAAGTRQEKARMNKRATEKVDILQGTHGPSSGSRFPYHFTWRLRWFL